jgi:hypothetical protein
MGNFKKKTQQEQDREIADQFKKAGASLGDDFMRSMVDAASRSDVNSVIDMVKQNQDDLWITDKVLNFADFCASADHMNFPPLSPRQNNVAEYMFGDDPKNMFFNNRNLAILVYGKGCMSADSEVFTADGRVMRMDDCARLGLPVKLFAMDGNRRIVTALSSPAIKKQKMESSVRITTHYGHVSTVSKHHKFYTQAGWMKASDLHVGDAVYTARTIPVPTLNEYDESICRDVARGVMSDPSPSRRIPVDILFAPLASRAAFLKEAFGNYENQHIETNSMGVLRDLDFMLRGFSLPCKMWNTGKIKGGCDVWAIGPEEHVTRDIGRHIDSHVSGISEQMHDDDMFWEEIVSIVPVRRMDVYTFTVPGYKNYVQGSLIHHNSGKDTIAALLQCYIVYVLLNLRNPQRFFQMPDNVNIDLLNIAACVTKDTMIRVNKSWRPVDDIAINDMAEYLDGTECKVEKLIKHEDQPVFELILKNGLRVKCTGNHKFKIRHGASWREVELSNLKAGDKMWYKKCLGFSGEPLTSRINYTRKTCGVETVGPSMHVNEDMAYAIGLFVSLGDMSTRSGQNGRFVRWNIPSYMKDVCEKMGSILSEKFGDRLRIKHTAKSRMLYGRCPNRSLTTYSVYARDFYEHLVNLGVRPSDRCGFDGFPYKIFSAPDAVVKSMMAGIIDGGGFWVNDIDDRHAYYFRNPEVNGWVAFGLNGLGADTELISFCGKTILGIPQKSSHVLDALPTLREIKQTMSATLGRQVYIPGSDVATGPVINETEIISIKPCGREDVFDYVAPPRKEMISNAILGVDSKEQAQTVYFQIFSTFVRNWSWLRNQWDIVINGRFFSSGQQEADFINKVTITNDAILFPHNIRAFSGSSEAETLEGKNVLMFVLDEVDAFKEKSVTRSAKKIYRTVRTSAVSRFGTKYKGFIISYPRSEDGFIMQMYHQTKKLLSVYGDIAKTWEVKPRHLFSKEEFEFEGEKVPMEFFDEFRLDPHGCKAAYLCRPPKAESVYFEDYDKLELAAKGFTKPLYEFSDTVENLMVKKKMTMFPIQYNQAINHILVLDLSLKSDPTALTLMHRDNDKIVTDFVTTWNPDPAKGTQVDLQNVESIIEQVCQHVNVKALYADRWQSALLIQKLRERGLNANTVKLDFEDFESFKRLLYAGNIIIPRNEQLFRELRNIQRVTQARVDHPDGEHNDITVTLVMGTKMLISDKASKGDGISFSADGELVKDNMFDRTDVMDEFADSSEDDGMGGVQIDGIPL